MDFEIVFDLEEDGRWIAAVERLPGVMAYGATQNQARLNVIALAEQVLVEQSLSA